jgi:nitrite reductase/ring-hydroxylating ferredoxin subunit
MPNIILCKLTDIPDGGAKGVEVGRGADALDIILLLRGSKVFAYKNRCPHQGTPLETFPDKFLDQTGKLLICSTHGARFRVRDGVCVEGPCEGASLEPLVTHISDGHVTLAKADSAPKSAKFPQ